MRSTFDDQGIHASVCLGAGPAANAKTRHDRLVKIAAEIGLQCGIQSRVHDGPVFDMGPVSQDRAKRPADWFEQGSELNSADAAAYYGGRCYDLTIRTGGASALEAAVKQKEQKYRLAMAAHPHLALTVVGISASGEVSSGTSETLTRWAGCLARHRRATADLLGCPQKEVRTAFGLGFAMVSALQLAAYVNELTSGRKGRVRTERMSSVPVGIDQATAGRRPLPPTEERPCKRGRPAQSSNGASDRVSGSQGARALEKEKVSGQTSILSVEWTATIGSLSPAKGGANQ